MHKYVKYLQIKYPILIDNKGYFMEQIVEYLVIVFISIGLLMGLIKGFTKIFFSWFSIFIGIIISINFSYGIEKVLFDEHNIITVFLIGVVLFALVYIIVMQVSSMFSEVLRRANVELLDHLLGGIFGAVQTMIFVGLAIYWAMDLRWINLSSQPASMFSMYWAEKIITLVGSQVDVVNKLL